MNVKRICFDYFLIIVRETILLFLSFPLIIKVNWNSLMKLLGISTIVGKNILELNQKYKKKYVFAHFNKFSAQDILKQPPLLSVKLL